MTPSHPASRTPMIINKSFAITPGTLNSFVNPFSFSELLKLKDHDSLLSNFNLYMDGVSLVWAARLAGSKDCGRFSFDDTSVAPLVFAYAREHGLKVGLIGSKREIIESTARLLPEKYGINVTQWHDGYFNAQQQDEVAEQFLDCQLVICSMGTPRQEQFLLKMQELGWQGTGFTCGGFFDQLTSAGGTDYYPKMIDRFNLRWAYRIYREPRRLWKRYFVHYPIGLVRFGLSLLAGRTRIR